MKCCLSHYFMYLTDKLSFLSTGLIIFTIARYRRLKTITNIFLASLASADLLLVIICVPVNVSRLQLTELLSVLLTYRNSLVIKKFIKH